MIENILMKSLCLGLMLLSAPAQAGSFYHYYSLGLVKEGWNTSTAGDRGVRDRVGIFDSGAWGYLEYTSISRMHSLNIGGCMLFCIQPGFEYREERRLIAPNFQLSINLAVFTIASSWSYGRRDAHSLEISVPLFVQKR